MSYNETSQELKRNLLTVLIEDITRIAVVAGEIFSWLAEGLGPNDMGVLVEELFPNVVT